MPEKTKVLLVISGSEFGGGEKVFYQLATGMDKRHYEPIVACSSAGLLARWLREGGIRTFDVRMTSRYDLRPLRRLVHFIRQEGVDIIHTQGSRANFLGRLAGRFTEQTVTVSTIAMLMSRESHADVQPLRRSTYVWFDKATCRLVDTFLVLSDFHRQGLVEDYGVQHNQVIKIHNGIEMGMYDVKQTETEETKTELGLVGHYPVIGIVGRLVFQKGIPYLLKAMPQITSAFPNARLLVVGDGVLRNALEELAQKIGVRDICLFTGFRQDIPRILSALDVLVMPSLYEGMPMAILEAMAAGKPVIATNVGGTSELIAHGRTGLLVPPTDISALGQAMISVLMDRGRADEMGALGRRRVAQFFSVEKMVRATEQVYRDLRTHRAASPAEIGRASA